MDFVLSALDYLLGIPILGWGMQIGFVYKALLLLVGLLIFTAFILLADRKIWAAVQIRRGPNVVGPFGLLQSFADLLKFALKEADHSGRRRQAAVPARAAADRHAGARRLGRHPRQ